MRLHPNAQRLSEIAEASARFGKFWGVHERLMSHRQLSGNDVLRDLVASHVDVEKLEPLLASASVVERIERDVAARKASGVHGASRTAVSTTNVALVVSAAPVASAVI